MDVENFKRLFLPLHPKLFRIAYARWSKTRPMPKISCKMPTISCGVGGMN